jgi:hypothetical protein
MMLLSLARCVWRSFYWYRADMIDKFGTFPIVMKKRHDRNPCLPKAATN